MQILKKHKKNLIKPLKKNMNKKFRKKQLRFAFSKVAIIFYDKKIDEKILIDGEKLILNSTPGPNMFIESFKLLNIFNDNIDWLSFGKMMWYCFQTSTYWKDIKINKFNIYNNKNYIEMNEKRRKYYYNWLFSVSKETKNFNETNIEIMKVVF